MIRSRAAAQIGLCVMSAALVPGRAVAITLDLAALSCDKYENAVLTSAIPEYAADPIDTVMWLFGFATAKAGERVLYGDSLRAFGFALDGECKTNPTESLLEAALSVKSQRDNPMDLTRLNCATFERRHAALRTSDPESAKTLTMWMFGYAVGLSGGHVLNFDALARFDAALDDRCTRHPADTVFDALRAPNEAILTSRPTGAISR